MRITWDSPGDRYYKSGVDHGVFYPLVGDQYVGGVAWNGLTEVSPAVNGYDTTPLYVGHVKRSSLRSNAEFGGSISAYTYPDEFERCMGSIESDIVPGMYVGQQDRQTFGLCYRTKIGNDIDGIDHGYELHLIYGCVIDSISSDSSTLSSDPEATEFSWDYSCDPVDLEGYLPTSELVIKSTSIDQEKLRILEDFLYGTNYSNPILPFPHEIIAMFTPQPEEIGPRDYSGYPEIELFEDNDLYPKAPEYASERTMGVAIEVLDGLDDDKALKISDDVLIVGRDWVNVTISSIGNDKELSLINGSYGITSIVDFDIVTDTITGENTLILYNDSDAVLQNKGIAMSLAVDGDNGTLLVNTGVIPEDDDWVNAELVDSDGDNVLNLDHGPLGSNPLRTASLEIDDTILDEEG